MPESNTNSSFIPKNSGSTKKRARPSRRIYLLSYISYIVFFSVLITALGTYLYTYRIEVSLQNVKTELAREQKSFNTSDLNRVKDLDDQLNTAKSLIDDSVAVSRIFDELEKVVTNDVRFIGFSYMSLPNKEFSIELTGIAGDFNPIIYQRDVLNKSKLLQDMKVASYDYSLGQDIVEGIALQSGTPTLSFILSDVLADTSIAYIPESVSNEDANSLDVISARPNDLVESTSTTTTENDAMVATSTETVDSGATVIEGNNE